MDYLLILNKIKNNIECKICFESFITLTNNNFDKFNRCLLIKLRSDSILGI